MNIGVVLLSLLFLCVPFVCVCRSQWPCGLMHELPSPAQTQGSWVRIPHEAWMSEFSLFVPTCVQVAALGRADPPPKGPTDCVKDQETEKAAKV
jgi:hypothetical protein